MIVCGMMSNGLSLAITVKAIKTYILPPLHKLYKTRDYYIHLDAMLNSTDLEYSCQFNQQFCLHSAEGLQAYQT